MTNRWTILAVLFFARTTMAFQFQSVAALSPLLIDTFKLSIIDIGLLIGLFLGPGVLVAIPGGGIAARFGDKRVTAISLGMMLVGSMLMSVAQSWDILVAGRVLAGIGGVIINIIMTKMVVDWFTGREMGTAMGIFIGSWPFGIALALAVLPYLAGIGGLGLAWMGLNVLTALALVALLLIYRAPDGLNRTPPTVGPAGFRVVPMLLSAIIWAFYNSGLAMVFGFGTLLLTQSGVDPITAGSVISVFMLALCLGIPLGGFLADRSGHRDAVIAVGLVVSALSLPMLIVTPLQAALPVYALVGLFFGLPGGPIMTTPAQVLAPPVRAFGMGVFFAIYYAVMMVAPGVAGGFAERAGDAAIAFVVGSVLLFASVAALIAFRYVTDAPKTA